MENERKDLFPGALEMMILQTLRIQPLHGYALAQHIKRVSKELLKVEEVSLSSSTANAEAETGAG